MNHLEQKEYDKKWRNYFYSCRCGSNYIFTDYCPKCLFPYRDKYDISVRYHIKNKYKKVSWFRKLFRIKLDLDYYLNWSCIALYFKIKQINIFRLSVKEIKWTDKSTTEYLEEREKNFSL